MSPEICAYCACRSYLGYWQLLIQLFFYMIKTAPFPMLSWWQGSSLKEICSWYLKQLLIKTLQAGYMLRTIISLSTAAHVCQKMYSLRKIVMYVGVFVQVCGGCTTCSKGAGCEGVAETADDRAPEIGAPKSAVSGRDWSSPSSFWSRACRAYTTWSVSYLSRNFSVAFAVCGLS